MDSTIQIVDTDASCSVRVEQPPNDFTQTNDSDRISYGLIQVKPNKPIGVTFCGSFFKFNSISTKRICHKTLLLCITFIAYTCFHMGRRPLSIVKNVLNRNCSNVHQANIHRDFTYTNLTAAVDPTWCDWAPFNDDVTANHLLALLDSAFLFSYAFFMFFSGYLADRCNLRYYLSGGMIISGVLLYAFGVAFYMNIHSMSYFVIIQILSGIAQTTGWPSVVTCIGNWFSHTSRGSIFGFWNSNTNMGNIIGATIAGYFAERAWGLSFMVPGFIMLVAGVMTFLFLVPRPQDVGLISGNSQKLDGTSERSCCEYDNEQAVDSTSTVSTSRRSTSRRKLNQSLADKDDLFSEAVETEGISTSEQSPLIYYSGGDVAETETIARTLSFWDCLKIPGVIEYSFSLGFAKLVSYTFLYWLPRYITQSTSNNSESSAYLSVPFDIGGMFGAIIAGYLSDKYRKYATICTVMLILAIPAMFLYEEFASLSNLHNVCLQLITGLLVTGPYSLITTAVSVDLGSRVKDGNAMATVAAVIDGAGSVGAAIGPLVAGYISESGWKSVFIMLMASDLIASLFLIRITLKELGLS